MSFWSWLFGTRKPPKPSPYPITGRDDEFRATIRQLYLEELGREPDPSGMANFLHAAQYGSTGEQIRAALHDSDEGIAYRNRPPVDDPADADGGERLPLHMDGVTIRTDDNAVWRYAGITAFRLFKRFADGEDVDELLTNYLTCGGLVPAGKGPNTVRVLLSASVLFDLPTQNTTREVLDAFLSWLTLRGVRCEAVVLVDANPDNSVYPDARPTARTQSEQQAFLDRVAPVLAAHWNAIGELGNECSHKITQVDRGAFRRPVGSILWERGSGQADEPPFVPPWELVGNHAGRQDDWPRRLPARDIRMNPVPASEPDAEKTNRWQIHAACIENEPMGCADTEQPGRRSSNPDDFAQFAAHAGMNSNGALFHPDAGLQTTMLSAKQAECGAAFYAGLHFAPAESQLWPYRRGGLTGPLAPCIAHVDRYDANGHEVRRDGALRTFSKESPDGDGYSVAIRPGPDWVPVALDGRRIVAIPRRGLVRTQR